MSETRRVVPLVETLPLSEFGDFLEDRASAVGLERDGTYVPGFSEMRVDRDLKVGQYLRREITREEIPNLPVNLRWARNQNKAGHPDNSKPFNHSRKGYAYVEKKDVGTDWLKELPGGTVWDAEGHLRNGDMVLMVASGKDAARNEANRRRELEARTSGITNTFTQNLAQAGIRDTKGTAPTMERIGADAKIFGDKP